MPSAIPSVVVLGMATPGSTTSLPPVRLLDGQCAAQTGKKVVGRLVAIVLCACASISSHWASGDIVCIFLRHLQEVGQFARPRGDASSAAVSRRGPGRRRVTVGVCRQVTCYEDLGAPVGGALDPYCDSTGMGINRHGLGLTVSWATP